MKNFKKSFNAIVLPSAFFAAIMMLLLLIGTSYKQMNNQYEIEDLINHSHTVHIEIQQLVSNIKEAESAQRGFLLIEDPVFLKPFYTATSKVNSSFSNLKKLTKDNPEQQRNTDTLSILIHRKFYILSKTLFDKTHQNLAHSNLIARLNVGREVMDTIITLTNSMIAVEMRILKEREEAHQLQLKFSPIVFFITALFALGVFALAFLKIKQDLSQLKSKNNQLLINEELFDYSERLAEISTWFWDVETNLLTYSKNQYRLLGCEPDEFEPTVENFTKYVHPEDQYVIKEGNQKVLEEGKASLSYFRVIRKDGTIRNFKSSGKFITDSYGKKMLIGVNADITEQTIKDKELEDKLIDLEQSNKELSAFNHVASHDLQEPLRKIQTFISRIKDKDFDVLSETTKEYFIRVQKTANRMQKLIDDLLLFSRTNKANKVFEKTNLNEILENSKLEFAEPIEARNAIIKSTILPTISGISFQLQQLFDNLIGNSLKYTLSKKVPHIEISASILSGDSVPNQSPSHPKKFYKITITDNGIGFDQEYAESIFTLFHRLHDTKEYSGTGIGLAICKKIVDNHKGYITAQSEPNKGATFNIFLPV